MSVHILADLPGLTQDTLTQDDIVRNQYLTLPYPAVSYQELEEERQHYIGENKDIPFETYSTFSLDSLNHYLYNGENHFGWEL